MSGLEANFQQSSAEKNLIYPINRIAVVLCAAFKDVRFVTPNAIEANTLVMCDAGD
jgi:hypothetical protein